MSDRCSMFVRCLSRDKEVFAELGFDVVDTSKNDLVVEMHDEQANYAHSDDLPMSILYTGGHGEGGAYGSMEFCCDGHNYYEAATHHDGGVVVRLNPNGKISRSSLNQARAYLRAFEQVNALLDAKEKE